MKTRRDFLKNVALTASGVSLLSIEDANSATMLSSIYRPSDSVFSISTIKGKVHYNGQGLAKVVVSDGVHTVQTNSKGEYSLLTSSKQKFVFISIPSGYEIKKQANGSASFFYRLDHSKSTQNIDFALSKLKDSDIEHCFVVLADPQIQKADEAQMLLNETVPDVIDTINELNTTNVFGFGCGDLIWDKHELFDSYNQAVQNIDIPFFQVFGNHDADLEQRSDEKATYTFNAMYGPQYYSFNRGLIHYVVLDDVFFIGKDKEYIGYVSEEQLAWLEQDLSYVPKGNTVVIAQHIPSYTGHFERNPQSNSLGAMVSNREHLYKIVEEYNVHMLSGHTHFNENVVLNDNLYEHCHGTVCGAWWSGPICYDGTPSGYGVYKVNGSELSWYYKGTGLAKETQFRIYQPHEAKEFNGNWCVNIWNWDSEWSACYYEDGVKKGNLVQVRGLDPLSVKLHSGPKLPERRKWVEPALTDHLFLFKPSIYCNEVKIEVTDRFGNIYEEVILI